MAESRLSLTPKKRRNVWYAGGTAVFVAVALGVTVQAASRERAPPARCPIGMIALGTRCCGRGQSLINEDCSGTPTSCAAGLRGVGGPRPGCVAIERRVSFAAGVLRVAHADWEPQGDVQAREARVGPFELDAYEVTVERWQHCVAAGGCRKMAEAWEPGRPVTHVSPVEALQFCRFFGGRLPTADEWMYAAGSASGRRYPWGASGLVCRRAAFGLVNGPCAQGATGPDIAGCRPDGRTPEGVFDLAGNVAEWTLESKSNRGRPEFAARGGSYASPLASELKTWSIESTDRPAAHIGFRCAYAPD